MQGPFCLVVPQSCKDSYGRFQCDRDGEAFQNERRATRRLILQKTMGGEDTSK